MLPGPGSGPSSLRDVRDARDVHASRPSSATARRDYETWNPKSVLTSEYANVVRSVLPGNQQLDLDGDVQHEAIHYDVDRRRNADPYAASSEQRAAGLGKPDNLLPERDKDISSERVRLEAERVQARFASSVNPSTEVTLRFDFLNSRDTRVAMLSVYAATFAGFIVLVVQFINIMTKDNSTRRFHHNTTFICNIAIGTVCLSLIIAIFVIHVFRLLKACRQHKVWSHARKRVTILFMVEAAVQGINLVCYIIPNVYLLHNPSHFYSVVVNWCGWVRWTCWNTLFMLFLVHAYGGRMLEVKPKPKALMEGPWRKFWPCLLPWVAMQVVMSSSWLHTVGYGSSGALDADSQEDDFGRGIYFDNCEPDLLTRATIDVTVGIAFVGTVFTRLQLRLRIEVMLFFGLCLVLLWLVRLGSCASYEFVALGIMPMQIVMTANAFVWSFICMPYTPHDDAAAKRIWDSEFAWTEADKPIKLAARALTVPKGSSLNQEPMFCFQTMMAMWYWSCLVYDYQRVKIERKRSKRASPEQLGAGKAPATAQKTVLDLAFAMNMYDLTGSELFCEVKRDTRCLMGWSDSTVVLAFRGTASMTNALSDLQAWRVAHPPARGHNWLFSRPLVHLGFLRSWLAGAFNDKVVNRTMEVVNSRKPASGKLQILITGHSLGGAFATLAAYDICKQLQGSSQQDVEVRCYIFGAPRTGNHAFAADYNRVVPDTWSIINDQDVVTRGGKFVVLYKRPGKRVIVNNEGRMMVSPSSMEASIQQSIGGQKADHHLLTSYHQAVMSVILAQFTPKGFIDGMEGIVRLVEGHEALQRTLRKHMGMHLDEMRHLCQLGPDAREDRGLPGAHPPARGFYKIRSRDEAQKEPACNCNHCGNPFWWLLRPASHDNDMNDLHHDSIESEVTSTATEDQ
ncbi:hypothetical protein WJX79_010181 [Trebouxia sp. C0005]